MIKYLEGLADAKHCHCSGSKRADMPDVDGRKVVLGTSPGGAAGYDKISRRSSRCKALPLLVFQKGRYARNGLFPLKSGLFLVYSTIAEIRSKFDISGPPKGRWARNGRFH